LERGIITETLSITNFEFSATFTAAIEAKVAAEQAVLEAQNKLERVKVEARCGQRPDSPGRRRGGVHQGRH
jgi:hypothetical protein